MTARGFDRHTSSRRPELGPDHGHPLWRACRVPVIIQPKIGSRDGTVIGA
jgi:hypothetical protein